MVVTTREAERMLAESDSGAAGVSRHQARRLLQTGIIGQPVRRGRALCYDEEAVRWLRDTPEVPEERLMGLRALVVRLGASRSLDLSAPWEQQAAVVGERWGLSIWTRIWVRSAGRELPDGSESPAPVIATVGHRVVFCADLIGWRSRPPAEATAPRDEIDMSLVRPGSWAAGVAGHRVTLGPGNPWRAYGLHTFVGRRGDPMTIDAFLPPGPRGSGPLSAAGARAARPPDRR
jgi:hypothetical protein